MSDTALVEELRGAIARGDSVTVVGTGVSIIASGDQDVAGYKVARWDGLLRHGVHQCRDVEKILDENNSKLLEAQIDTPGSTP